MGGSGRAGFDEIVESWVWFSVVNMALLSTAKSFSFKFLLCYVCNKVGGFISFESIDWKDFLLLLMITI